jgi:phosphate/sulfate permease
MGVRWVERVPPRGEDALRLVLYGWVVTLPVAAAIAAVVALGSRGWL